MAWRPVFGGAPRTQVWALRVANRESPLPTEFQGGHGKACSYHDLIPTPAPLGHSSRAAGTRGSRRVSRSYSYSRLLEKSYSQNYTTPSPERPQLSSPEPHSSGPHRTRNARGNDRADSAGAEPLSLTMHCAKTSHDVTLVKAMSYAEKLEGPEHMAGAAAMSWAGPPGELSEGTWQVIRAWAGLP